MKALRDKFVPSGDLRAIGRALTLGLAAWLVGLRPSRESVRTATRQKWVGVCRPTRSRLSRVSHMTRLCA